MIDSKSVFRVNSYKDLNDILCKFIYSRMPKPPVSQSSASGFLLSPFSVDDMNQTLPDLQPKDLYRPSSPIVLGNNNLLRMRTENKLDFHIAGVEKTYHVFGSGKLLTGVGAYCNLFSQVEALEEELNALFRGQLNSSQNQNVNDLYALIIGVEGCARSAHNIALSRIFLKIIKQLKRSIRINRCFN